MIERIQGNGFAMFRHNAPKHLMLTTARKNVAPSVDLAENYQRIFDYFNHEVFEKEFGHALPRCILNLSRKRGAAAFFWSKQWKDPVSGEMLDEISLIPEWTNLEPRDVLANLVHEMAHFLDHLQGTAAKGGYHGKSWYKIMSRIGLPGRALSKTQLKVTHDIEEGGAFDVAYRKMDRTLVLPFITSRDPMALAQFKPATLQGKRARYECGQCHLIVRAPSGKRIGCLDCDLELAETGV